MLLATAVVSSAFLPVSLSAFTFGCRFGLDFAAMTVAVVPLHAKWAATMVQWAAQFARAHEQELLVVYPLATKKGDEPCNHVVDLHNVESDKRVQGSAVLKAACESIAALGLVPTPAEGDKGEDTAPKGKDTQDSPPATTVKLLVVGEGSGDRDLAAATIDALQKAECDLLILPRHERKRTDSHESLVEQALFRDAPCETLEFRPGSSSGEKVERILVPVSGDHHDKIALQWAQRLAEHHDATVTALFIEPHIGRDSELVGKRIVRRIVRQTLGDSAARIESQVVVANDVFQGLETVDIATYDLVLVGASHHGTVRRLLFGTVSDHLMEKSSTAVAAVREKVPLANRLRRSVEQLLRAHVPQLEREQRVALVERVQSNSQWDFDFVALMGLATTIATFGLIQNAGAVVIGAMLVAPLMTPLLGIGLSLVQGNVALLRSAGRSVFSGFLLAFLLGVGIGAVSGLEAPTGEMLGRGSPNWMDLVIAFVSGAAAAYATSRPDLSSALPGVAIAAALVPPIATAGLGLYLGDERLCWGAILLFITNILAIVIATALTLWGVGIRGSHDHGALQRWAKWGRFASVVGIALVIVMLTRPTQQATRELRREIQSYLKANTECVLEECFLVEEEGVDLARIRIRSREAPSPTIVNEIAALARKIAGENASVRVETTLAFEVSAP